MTHKELEKYFASPLYDEVREYINLVMEKHPEITDKNVIGAAAEEIFECQVDGAEITVDDALRLTSGKKFISDPADIQVALESGEYGELEAEIAKKLGDIRGRKSDVLNNLAENVQAYIEQQMAGDLKPEAFAKAHELTRLGTELSNNNNDIVLMGVPDLKWSDAELKVAFFTDKLAEEDLKILYDMKLVADRVKFKVDNGIAYATFYLYDIRKK